jgi:hypothetical protein
MISNSHINPSLYKDFFVNLFRETQYISEPTDTLFRVIIEKSPEIFDELLKQKLRIDPFTKQSNYSVWLTETRKLRFLEDLRKLPQIKISSNIERFDTWVKSFKDINRYDRAI